MIEWIGNFLAGLWEVVFIGLIVLGLLVVLVGGIASVLLTCDFIYRKISR